MTRLREERIDPGGHTAEVSGQWELLMAGLKRRYGGRGFSGERYCGGLFQEDRQGVRPMSLYREGVLGRRYRVVPEY